MGQEVFYFLIGAMAVVMLWTNILKENGKRDKR